MRPDILRQGLPIGRMWKLILKFAVTAALIWIIVSKVDTEALGAQFARLEVLPVVLAALVLWATSLIAAWRWRAVIGNMMPKGEHPPGFIRLYQLLWIGLFFNQTLPSAAGGDAMRMWLARRSRPALAVVRQCCSFATSSVAIAVRVVAARAVVTTVAEKQHVAVGVRVVA